MSNEDDLTSEGLWKRCDAKQAVARRMVDDREFDLHTHDLQKLFRAASVDLKAAPKEVQPAIRQVLDWERNHDYSAARMPRRVTRDMVEAAFGAGGVVEWLRRL